MQNLENRMSIFDMILKDKEDQFEATEPISELPVVNRANFFTDQGTGGFISKETFLKLIRSLSSTDVATWDSFLKELSNKASINGDPLERPDKQGRSYIWMTIRKRRGEVPFKLITAEKISTFIGVYQAGLLNCSLTLEELYKEALIK